MNGIGEPAATAAALDSVAPLQNAILARPRSPSFGETLSSAIDSLSNAMANADALAVQAVEKKAEIADAAIARAKADVMLEVAAIASAKLSGAISQLLQTQL